MCNSKKLRLKFGAWQLTSPRKGGGEDQGEYDQISKIKIWLYNFMIEMKVVRNVILNSIDPWSKSLSKNDFFAKWLNFASFKGS